MDNYGKESEKNLLEVIRQKERADKQLLSLEIFLGYLCSAIFIALVFVASYVQMANWLRTVLIGIGFILFAVGVGFANRIEQTAGYYVCAKCGYRYVPSYKSVFISAHWGRTRHMRCPRCGGKSWQKKVLNKEPNKE